MPKTRPDHFGPAECARRTGLTIRALKVYERHGLIVPARDARRWRMYGPKELVRLNAIRTLKGLGLSLRQVRDILTRQGPPLRQVLRLQVESWRARKAAAEQAIRALQGVFEKVERTQELGIDELAALLRPTDPPDPIAVSLQLAPEILTRKERRLWGEYTNRMTPPEAEAARQLYAAGLDSSRQFRAIMDAGFSPASTAAQALLRQRNAVSIKHRSREHYLRIAHWNVPIARKIYVLSQRIVDHVTAPDRASADGKLTAFLYAVQYASPYWKAMQKLCRLGSGLYARAAAPNSAVGEDLARRLRRLCREHDLGDASVFALHQAVFGMKLENGQLTEFAPPMRAAWQFLHDASVARAGRKRSRHSTA